MRITRDRIAISDQRADTASVEQFPAKADYCSKTGDTISVNSDKPVLNSEERIISKERRKQIKNNYRVPVLNPDGTPAMPTTNRRANEWLKEGKAINIKNKLGIFQVQLLKEPSGRNKQDIVLTDGP